MKFLLLAFFTLMLLVAGGAIYVYGKDQRDRGVVESVVLRDAYGKCWRVENKMYVSVACPK